MCRAYGSDRSLNPDVQKQVSAIYKTKKLVWQTHIIKSAFLQGISLLYSYYQYL
ncbi:MAG: hypothetical protein JWQ30_2489 [Sediminibacterium sp.]|nr:hypothetical protein [Sediminibacterium sp.]